MYCFFRVLGILIREAYKKKKGSYISIIFEWCDHLQLQVPPVLFCSVCWLIKKKKCKYIPYFIFSVNNVHQFRTVGVGSSSIVLLTTYFFNHFSYALFLYCVLCLFVCLFRLKIVVVAHHAFHVAFKSCYFCCSWFWDLYCSFLTVVIGSDHHL